MREQGDQPVAQDGVFVEVQHPAPGVREIRLARPEKRNALNTSMLRQLDEALEVADDVRVVVLSAEGHVFSAGVDIQELHGDERDLVIDASVHDVARKIRALRVPTLAAIDRSCIGAANELVVACDGLVAVQGASLRLPALQMGLLYHPETMQQLQDRFGVSVTTRLVLLQQEVALKDIGAGVVMVDDGPDAARKRTLEIAAALAEAPVGLLVQYKRMLAGLASGESASEWEQRYVESFTSDARSAAIARAKDRTHRR